jgi:hypothetical protein
MQSFSVFQYVFVKVACCIGALWLKLLLDQFYVLFSKQYAYYGMVLNPAGQHEYLLSYISVAFIALVIDNQDRKPSSIIWTLMFIFCFIPAATVFSMNASHPAWAFYGLLISFLIVSILLQVGYFQNPRLISYMKWEGFYSGLWLLFGFTLLAVVLYHGFRLRWVHFSEVYDVRAAYTESGNRLIGYLYGWLSHVLNIALLLVALNKRKYWLATLAMAVQVYLYTLGGHKSVLLLIPFVLWVYVGVRFFTGHYALYMITSLIIILSTMLAYDLHQGHASDVSSITIRRNMLLPAQIYFHYTDYFSRYYSDFFAQHFPFNMWYESHYNEKLPVIIGKNYFTFKEGIYANGNIFADLYANLGSLSFIAGPILIVIILKVFDIAAAGKNSLFVMPLAAVSVVSLSNSGMIVNLITHGLWLMIFLIALYPKTVLILRFSNRKQIA